MPLNGAMALHSLTDLAVLEFRVWTRKVCLQHFLRRLEAQNPGGMTYRHLRQSCLELLDLIDQLIVDPDSSVSHRFI